MTRQPVAVWGLVVALGLVTGCAAADDSTGQQTPAKHALDDVLAVNHVQVKGTHNSYHRKPKVPGQAWNYEHAPLDVQLGEQGVRQFELDAFYNADKKRYDVFHFPVVDAETTCETLAICLQTMKDWSDKHPAHLPLFVSIEPKDEGDPTGSKPDFSALDQEIDAIWPRNRRIQPDDVRGNHPDLKTAVAADGWPKLGDARGKALFVLLDGGKQRDMYVAGNAALKGRVMFAEGGADKPWGVIARIDGPVGGEQAIKAAVQAGRIIRTRADSGAVEAKAKDYSRFDAALRSGAQLISTDFPAKGPDYDYEIVIPGGNPARCNPVTAPSECTAEAIEDL